MSGSQTTIEEQVMSSARTYLFGHALAWEIPGRETAAPRRAGSAGRAWALLVAAVARVAPSRRPQGRPDPSLGGC